MIPLALLQIISILARVQFTKTRPFNIMALFRRQKNEKFQMKKKVTFLLFLLETDIVGTR